MKLLFIKKCNQPQVRKERNKYSKLREDFINCLKFIINELGHCPGRPDNVYFDNNEQASLAVFTTASCIC